MKALSTTLAVLLLYLTPYAQPSATWNWVLPFGGPRVDVLSTLAMDTHGHLYVAGNFMDSLKTQSQFETSQGIEDALLVKLDPSDGHAIWYQHFGGKSHDHISKLLAAPDGSLYLSASLMGPDTIAWGSLSIELPHHSFATVLAKVDSSGNPIWAKTLLGDSLNDFSRVTDLAMDRQGDLYLSGLYRGEIAYDTVALNLPATEVFQSYLMSVTAEGALRWTETPQGSFGQTIEALYVDKQDRLFVAGRFKDSIQIGTTRLLGQAGADIFLAQYTPNGTALWAQALGGDAWESPTDLVVDDAGLMYLTGYFKGETDLGGYTFQSQDEDAFLLQFSPTMGVQWAKVFSGPGRDRGNRIGWDGQGDFLLAGFYEGNFSIEGVALPHVGEQDIFWLQFSPTGQVIRYQSGGSTRSDFASDILVAGDKAYLTGSFREVAIFGNLNPIGNGHMDGFVAQINYQSTTAIAPKHPVARISLSPNPNDGSFTIGGTFQPGTTLKIVDLTGRTVHQQAMPLDGVIRWRKSSGLFLIQLYDPQQQLLGQAKCLIH